MAFLDIDNDGVGPFTSASVALKNLLSPEKRAEKRRALESKFGPVGKLEAGNFKEGSVTNALKYMGSGGREGSLSNSSKKSSSPVSSTNPSKSLGRFTGSNARPSSLIPGLEGMLNSSRTTERSDLDMLLEELLGQTKEGHTWESRAQDEDMINQIFGSQLSAIANARNTTNERFNTSKAATQDLYDGHVNEIRTKDKAEYQNIAQAQAQGTNQVFDSGVKQMQDSQNANRAESLEMMKRLGLEASAPVAEETAQQTQGAITDLIQDKTSQQNVNTAYAGADMRRNDARAQSIADEGVSQQAELGRQLQDILGELGNKEADVNSSKSEALMNAFRRSEDNWRDDRNYSTDALGQLMKIKSDEAAQMAEIQAEAMSKQQESQAMNGSQMTTILNGLGIQDPSLQQQYSAAYTDAILNSNYTPGVQDQQTQMLKYLRDNNDSGLDLNMLRDLVSSNLNYGTYKPGTPMK